MRRALAMAALVCAAPAQAAWDTFTQQDPLKNQPSHFAVLHADRTIIRPSRRPEVHTKRGMLMAQCNARGELNLLFGVDGELVSHQRTLAEYRFDADAAREARMTGSTAHDFGGFWNIRANHPFLARLRTSNALLIRLSEPVWGSVELHFTTLGAAEALTPQKLPCLKRR